MSNTKSKIEQALPGLDISPIEDLAEKRDMLASLVALSKVPEAKDFTERMKQFLATKLALILYGHTNEAIAKDIHAHLAELKAYSVVVGELTGAEKKLEDTDKTLDEYIEDQIAANRDAFDTLTKKN